jgi:hypothetical protein
VLLRWSCAIQRTIGLFTRPCWACCTDPRANTKQLYTSGSRSLYPRPRQRGGEGSVCGYWVLHVSSIWIRVSCSVGVTDST